MAPVRLSVKAMAEIGENVLRAFARGERGVADLNELGIVVEFRESGVRVDEAAEVDGICVSLEDLATGYVVAWSRGVDDLRQWASVVLCLPALDLADLEDDPDGPALLETLWDAAEGEATGIDLAARLTSRWP